VPPDTLDIRESPDDVDFKELRMDPLEQLFIALRVVL
jgi:hypothetical protein